MGIEMHLGTFVAGIHSLMHVDIHCLYTLPLFVLHTFVEGMGVCLGRCIDRRKGDARCETRATDNEGQERN